MQQKIVMSAGGVLVNTRKQVALVWQPIRNTWSFPKGHAEEGETPLQTAVREIYEETGRQVSEPGKDLGSIERPGFTRIPRTRDMVNEQLESVRKKIQLFLFRTEDGKLSPVDTKHTACWFNLKDAIEALPHKSEKEFLRTNERLIAGSE